MKFKRVKRIKYMKLYYYHDYPYCELMIKSIPYMSTQECTYYYISIKSEDILIYDSIRDENRIYKGLEEVKQGVLQNVNKYRDFNGKIEIE